MQTHLKTPRVLRQVAIHSAFGCWTVLSHTSDRRKVLCRCACGTEREVAKSNLARGISTSCGCMGLHIGEDNIDVTAADLDNIRFAAGDVSLAPIPWAPGYIVSDAGVVYSVRRWKREVSVPFRALKVMLHSGGYPQVNLRVKGKSTITAVHRLVAEFFLNPKPFDGAVVRHLDGNPLNNCASNLAWGTQAENRADSVRHGTAAVGESVGSAKLAEADINRIRSLVHSGVAPAIVASAYGVNYATINDIIRGLTWRHVT